MFGNTNYRIYLNISISNTNIFRYLSTQHLHQNYIIFITMIIGVLNIAPKQKVDKFCIQTLIPSSLYIHMFNVGPMIILLTTEQRENNKQPGAIYIIFLLPLIHNIPYINNEHFLRHLNGWGVFKRKDFTFKLYVVSWNVIC